MPTFEPEGEYLPNLASNEWVQVFGDRVLKTEHAAIVVVGSSTMRGIRIEPHKHLASIAAKLGFDVANTVRRTLDRNRRMMPVGIAYNSNSIIEQRIHEEFVIGLTKI